MVDTYNVDYWSKRYSEHDTPWDIGYVATPIKAYFDQVKDKDIKILIPGAGNAYEAEYLWGIGFENLYVLDIAKEAIESLSKRVPEIPPEQLIVEDFFSHKGSYDMIVEQTFFCALPKPMRPLYAEKMHELLNANGRLVGLLFNDDLYEDHPPFGGTREEYEGYFKPYFEFEVFETAYNSIPRRASRELFINLVKR